MFTLESKSDIINETESSQDINMYAPESKIDIMDES